MQKILKYVIKRNFTVKDFDSDFNGKPDINGFYNHGILVFHNAGGNLVIITKHVKSGSTPRYTFDGALSQDNQDIDFLPIDDFMKSLIKIIN